MTDIPLRLARGSGVPQSLVSVTGYGARRAGAIFEEECAKAPSLVIRTRPQWCRWFGTNRSGEERTISPEQTLRRPRTIQAPRAQCSSARRSFFGDPLAAEGGPSALLGAAPVTRDSTGGGCLNLPFFGVERR